MYGINSETPKNCLDCPLCQGEYGKGNEKSYCAIKSKVKLKYRGSRPKGCPIIVDPLPQWQIEESEIIKAYTKGFDTGVETVKNERLKGEWNEIQAGMFACPFCGAGPHNVFKNFCPKCGADMRGAE